MAPLPTVPDYSGAQLKVIRSQNPDLTPAEFDTMIEIARAAGLNLFRRQLSAIVFSKKNADRRRVAYVVGIDGYRGMADRTGTYMPHEDPTEWVIDPTIDDQMNPAKLVSATVKVKKFGHGAWHTFSATAHWSEFAPIEDEWGEDETGRRRKTGKKKLADNWAKMPRLMLAKVAEAQALRRGWPDTMAGVYAEDEMERERVLDLTATEVLDEYRETERLAKIGGPNAVMMDWMDGQPLERVPLGKIADQLMAWIGMPDRSASEIEVLRDRNRHSFQEFWARSPGDALAVKTAIEERIAALRNAETTAAE